MTEQTSENIIPFARPKLCETARLITLQYDPSAIDIDLSQADGLVSYDINAMSLSDLRESYRCMVILMRDQAIRHLKEMGDLKRKHKDDVLRLLGGADNA